MKESDYQVIADKKLSVESLVGKRLNWANFLLLLADLRSVNEIIGERRDNIAELHDVEGDEGVADPDEFEEIPPWVTRQEVEEIVRAEADRIISELKHNPIKK
jgi:hypothetical protein